jgi:hypothetical protein
VGRDPRIGCHRDGVVCATNPHRIRRRARGGRLAHRGLRAPCRARAGGRRRAARHGSRPTTGCCRMALSCDGHGRATRTRLGLSADQRADAAAQRRDGEWASMRSYAAFSSSFTTASRSCAVYTCSVIKPMADLSPLRRMPSSRCSQRISLSLCANASRRACSKAFLAP